MDDSQQRILTGHLVLVPRLVEIQRTEGSVFAVIEGARHTGYRLRCTHHREPDFFDTYAGAVAAVREAAEQCCLDLVDGEAA